MAAAEDRIGPSEEQFTIFAHKSSSVAAIYGLQYAAGNGSASTCAKVKHFIERNTYVAKALDASHSVQGALDIVHTAIYQLKKFQIYFHKLASNSKEVLKHMNCDKLSKEYEIVEICDSEVRVLGIT